MMFWVAILCIQRGALSRSAFKVKTKLSVVQFQYNEGILQDSNSWNVIPLSIWIYSSIDKIEESIKIVHQDSYFRSLTGYYAILSNIGYP